MKALTIIQPWATLIAIEAKNIETRSWSTDYRGQLAIHAGLSKQFVNMRGKDYLCATEPFYSTLMEAGAVWRFGALPLGKIVATCKLIDCIKVQEKRCVYRVGRSIKTVAVPPYPDTKELAFGDYTVGRYAWILSDIEILREPIPAKGALGLWECNLL